MFVNKEKLAYLRNTYTKGTVVELLGMDDPQAPPVGTKGKVVYVDDAGQIGVAWDTGFSLSLIDGVDSFRIVSAPSV